MFRVASEKIKTELDGLRGSHVLRLPALRSLGHVKLHRLTLLQAPETTRLDR